MLRLKQSAAMMVATLWLSTTVMGYPYWSYDSTNNNVQLPSNVSELFADVYNNNSVSLFLKARQPLYANRTIREIAPGAFMSINYAMGNSLWLVTPQNTIIVIDSPESTEAATAIRNDMRQIPAIGNKPITFIIYTLFHGDHTFGTRAFVEDPANGGKAPTIIAHKKTVEQAEFFDIFKFIKMKRVTRVFGSLLPKSVAINAFPALSLGKVQYVEFWPSVLLDLEQPGDTQDVVLDGLPLRFIYVPAYTDDQTAVWFPTLKLLACVDSFYGMLPNIYTIRGEPARDALGWSQTIRLLRKYYPEVLYPSHLDPIFGREYIANILEKVADVIQYIHDQTVRLTAKGLTPDAVAKLIKLPDSLQNEPQLVQVYGAIEGHVKSAADRYTGWFNGEAEDLVPNTKAELAANMVRDFGRERIIQKARKAYQEGNYRWALTLATYVWRAENQSRSDALYWRTQAIKRIADNTLAVHWRNYLYATTLVDNGLVNPLYVSATLINSKPLYLYLHTIDMCFELMTFHLNPEKAAGVDVTIDLALTDDPRLPAGQVYRLRLRNSVLLVEKVAAVDPLQPTYYPSFQTTTATWRQILANKLTIEQAVANGAFVAVRGTNIDIEQFLAKFDFVDEL